MRGKARYKVRTKLSFTGQHRPMTTVDYNRRDPNAATKYAPVLLNGRLVK